MTLDGFAPRMEAIKSTLRPKLTAVAEALCPAVSELAGRAMYVHVAKHARRTVNAPAETWAAFAHAPRGYKKLPHFALAVSKHGVHARLVLKDEAVEARARLVKALPRKQKALADALAKAGVRGYAGWDHDTLPDVWSADTAGLVEAARVAGLKTGVFDVGVYVGAWKGPEPVLEAFRALQPLFALAVAKR